MKFSSLTLTASVRFGRSDLIRIEIVNFKKKMKISHLSCREISKFKKHKIKEMDRFELPFSPGLFSSQFYSYFFDRYEASKWTSRTLLIWKKKRLFPDTAKYQENINDGTSFIIKGYLRGRNYADVDFKIQINILLSHIGGLVSLSLNALFKIHLFCFVRLRSIFLNVLS